VVKQMVLQLPQLPLSLWTSMQVPLQEVLPAGHPQVGAGVLHAPLA
jgi:hypothetical protein